MIHLEISPQPLDVQACINLVMTPACGGIDVFIGTVRNQTKGREVVRLEFEAYEAMALSEMNKIAAEAADRWPLQHMAMHHRTGVLGIGDVPVVIAVSAAHRDAAFEACRYLIDMLKQRVPIWKKEVFRDGASWVAAHP